MDDRTEVLTEKKNCRTKNKNFGYRINSFLAFSNGCVSIHTDILTVYDCFQVDSFLEKRFLLED